MAITYITGTEGSGKSYYVTYYLYNLLKPETIKCNKFLQWYRYYFPLKPKYKYNFIYTNINQFNYDFHPLLRPLDTKVLYKNLTKLRHLSVNKGYNDEQLIEEAKKLDLYKVYFGFDEVQDYFSKKEDEVWLWWLTYHRHLSQDIFFLTQHLDQISSNYLKNGRFFYKMFSPASSMYKNRFSVSYYTCLRMTQKCREKSFSIPMVPQVGSLYTSGAKVEKKSFLRKFFIIIPFLIISLYFSFNYFFTTVSPESNITKDKNITKHNNIMTVQDKISNKDTSISSDFSTTEIFISFRCINKICYYKDKSLPLSLLLYLVENNTFSYKDIESINYNYKIYYFLVDEEFLTFLDSSFNIDSKKSFNAPKMTNFNLMGR